MSAIAIRGLEPRSIFTWFWDTCTEAVYAWHIRLAERRVERGAALLERVMPGSVASLDLESLDISSADDCALAQIYGNFNKAPWIYRRARYGVYQTTFGPSYELLTPAWKRVAQRYGAK